MDLAFIVPTRFLYKYATQGDIYLALAHLIDSKGTNAYTRFHRWESKRKRVILDNGLFEGAQVSTEDLIKKAALIGADTVCAPDKLYDSKGTIKAFKDFIKAKQEAGAVFKVMGIPQADNEADWWECFNFMNSNPDCSVIGLSILSIPQSFKQRTEKYPIVLSRIALIRQLSYYKFLGGTPIKPCHMLGLGETYADIILANRLLPDTIISNDSSSQFVHGMYGITYDRLGSIPGGKITEKLDFDIYEVLHQDKIQENIDKAKRFAND